MEPKKKSPKSAIIITILALGFVVLPWLAGLYLDFLWFQNLGFQDVFTKILSTKVWLACIVTAVFFAVLAFNILFADRKGPVTRKQMINKELSLRLKLGIAALLSIAVGLSYKGSWEKVLLYLNQSSFNIFDPVFGKDIAFYVFTLPFFQSILKFGMFAIIAAFIITALIYVLNGQVSWGMVSGDPKLPEQRQVKLSIKGSRKSKLHLSFLGSLFFILIAMHYYLKRYSVLYSTRGIVTGAGYTDVHVTLPILTFVIIIAVVIALELFIWPNILKKKNIIPLSIGAFLVIAFVALSVLPGVVQYFKVLPNELKVERPFIDNNIKFTRLAYGLDNIEEVSFDASTELSPTLMKDNPGTFANIRLWDHRPLKQTYNQLQEIRSYYDFNDVDIDRYTIDGKYRQVMLSARELNQNQLASSAQTWVNQKLVFTHGLGATLSPVNQFTSEGLPHLLVKDIPPKTDIDSLKITRPQIYYGEGPQEYVITNTATEEFDYPKGDQNMYTTYTGKGDVKIGSFWQKLLFTIRFGDLKLLLTGDISPESKVLFYRNIHERTAKLAPFLTMDPDPYVVISDGKLVWMHDGYTTADSYPYSEFTKIEQFSYINYIRNSVKVVTDAYDGSPTLYVSDTKDPIVQTYMNIFPSLFTSMKDMPADLREHVRYPELMFKIQSAKYGTYHMKDANVFYNKEDVWNIPKEVYGEGKEIAMEPYYIIMKLPDQDKEEFVLMTPFTPQNKDNMIGWLAARADGKDYGKLVVYKFSKEKLVYGPMQIEARIDQDATISEQLTLWGQRGSTVIRGNLLVIPIDHSIIYVEPLYIIADKTQLPELKRVIVSDGTRVIMERELDTALAKLFNIDKMTTTTRTLTSEDGEEFTVTSEDNIKLENDLVAQALRYYTNVENSMQEGDWSGIGQNLDNLKLILMELEKDSENSKVKE